MGDDPLRLRFDARTHPDPNERVAAWRDAFSLSVDVQFQAEEIEPFAAAADFLTIGPALLAHTSYTAHTVVRDRRTIARTGSEQVIFDVFPEGGAVGTVGGRPCRIGPGDCFMMDMRGTLRLRLLEGGFIGLIMPRRLFEAAAGGPLALHGRIYPASSPQAKLLGPLLATLAEEAGDLSAEAAEGIGAALVAMVAASVGGRGRGLAAALPQSDIAPHKPEATLARLRRHIERHAVDAAFDPLALAQAYGLSRTTLYRLFQPHGGVADAIRRRRAALAVQMLTGAGGGSLALAAIAQASGFLDERSMRRTLRAVYDATPAQLRRQPSAMVLQPDAAGISIGALLDDLPA